MSTQSAMQATRTPGPTTGRSHSPTAGTDTSRSNRILAASFFFFLFAAATIPTIHRFDVRATTVEIIARCGGPNQLVLSQLLDDAKARSIAGLCRVRHAVPFLEVFWREGDTQFHLAGKSLEHPNLGLQYDIASGRGIQGKGEAVTSLENMAYSNLSLSQEVTILGETYLLVGATNITMPMIQESVDKVESKPSFFCLLGNSDLEKCANKLCTRQDWENLSAGFIAQVVIGIHPRSKLSQAVSQIGRKAPYLGLAVPTIDTAYERSREARAAFLEAVMIVSICLASILVIEQVKAGLPIIRLVLVGLAGAGLGILFACLGI